MKSNIMKEFQGALTDEAVTPISRVANIVKRLRVCIYPGLLVQVEKILFAYQPFL